MLIAYISGHGFGHMTRACEVLRTVRELAPTLPMTVVSSAPETLVRRAVPGPIAFRSLECDAGLVQQDALLIDEAASADRCRAFEASWDAKVAAEAAFLRESSARAVLGDIPPLAFAAAARAGVPSLALGNFSCEVTKPGYGIVSDAIGAGTRLVYTDRGDFPEYPIMVREMPRYLPCVHVANAELRAGRLEGPIRRVLAQPRPEPPDLGGARRAAVRILESLG